MFDEQAVTEKLQDLIKTATNVKVVYDGVPEYPTQFPAVTIQPNNWVEEWGDLRDTTDIHEFIITVFIQLEADRLTSQRQLRDIVASVREILGDQDNITLDGLVDSSRLTRGQYIFEQKESKLYFCEITYQCRKRYNRF